MDGSRGARARVANARAQMAPLGVALLFGIVIIGTVGIVVFGGTALEQTQDRSEVQRAEHVLTLFDSRTAMVALGDSSTQTTELVGSGTYNVNDSAGEIRLVHVDYNGTEDETIYEQSMGALVYETRDTEVAYQGGGVWRKSESGQARMVSPPEFYFRQSTLTFPLIRITNSDSASGPIRSKVDANERSIPVYPNTSGGTGDGAGSPYDHGLEEPYKNPLENGTLVVYVQSAYYEGWAEYFRTRTEANVTEFPGNRTVKANLVSIGKRGKFPMPQHGNGIQVRGLEDSGHSLQTFSLTLIDDEQDNADFSNMKWSMWAQRGQRQIEYHIRQNGPANPGDPVELSVYYSPDSGNTYHGWKNDTFGSIEEGDFDSDGDTEKRIELQFTSQASMEYSSLSSSDTGKFSPNGNFDDPTTWDEHNDTVSWESRDFDAGDRETIENVTGHYFELMGEEFTLTVKDGTGEGNSNSNTVNEDQSYGHIDYPGNAKYIAYLHVTQNDVQVEFQ